MSANDPKADIRAGLELDAGFAAVSAPLHKDLAHWQIAQDRMVLAVPKGHPLTKRKKIRLRDLRNMPFVWWPRWVNPVFTDQMMRACAEGGLTTPRIVKPVWVLFSAA